MRKGEALARETARALATVRRASPQWSHHVVGAGPRQRPDAHEVHADHGGVVTGVFQLICRRGAASCMFRGYTFAGRVDLPAGTPAATSSRRHWFASAQGTGPESWRKQLTIRREAIVDARAPSDRVEVMSREQHGQPRRHFGFLAHAALAMISA